MRKYPAAVLAIAVAIGPASALADGLGGKVGGIGVGASVGVGSNGASVGVGASVDGVGGANVGGSAGASEGSAGVAGKVGGIGVGAGVGVGSNGASVGVDASVDGIGGANVGGSVGTSKGSLGANVGAGTNLGGVGGLSASPSAGDESTGSGAAPGSTANSRASAASGAATGPASVGVGKKAAAIVVTRGVRHAVALPRSLRPSKGGRDTFWSNTTGYPTRPLPVPLKAIPGTPSAVVRVCRQAIMSAAKPLGAVRVYAASAGTLRRHRRGALTAPIEVRIDYARQGGIEVRQARVGCRLDAAGQVVAVT
ncbi:hypothetical protein [Mesorhizobium sophorae]|uniref:hypothetical protein n=1 Tax=Mesorhizobium sophorae TaxID=1300294 RepID=UPI000BA4BAD6|nr:hypothetical protein [Mesorhizobium sophorae]